MSEALKSFIEKAKQDARLREKLDSCSVESWGDSHTPIDVDPLKVIEVALGEGYLITVGDIIKAQCQQLEQFWEYEMENSFVARRSLAKLQMTVRDNSRSINYYNY